MTYIDLVKKIDSLAPLPKTVLDVEEFKKTDNYDPQDLAKIIQQDPLMVSTILKTANSAMFGFVRKVDSLDRAIGLLGINFTISIALGSGIKNALNGNLNAYGTNSETFLNLANMQSNFVNLWINKIDFNLAKELILPSFLQESGKFLINLAIVENGQSSDFLHKIKNAPHEISSIEKEFIDMSTADVTSAIFKHWNIAPNIINAIKNIDDISKVLPAFEKHAKILNITKTVCNIVKPLDENCIQLAREKVKEYNFNIDAFDQTILKIRERIEKI